MRVATCVSYCPALCWETRGSFPQVRTTSVGSTLRTFWHSRVVTWIELNPKQAARFCLSPLERREFSAFSQTRTGSENSFQNGHTRRDVCLLDQQEEERIRIRKGVAGAVDRQNRCLLCLTTIRDVCVWNDGSMYFSFFFSLPRDTLHADF